MNSSDSATDWVTISLGDLAERRLDRHAGFDADQQQVERIGEGALDLELALGDHVLEEQHRRLQAEIGRADADADLDRHRLLHVRDQEDIEGRADEQHDRRHQAEEQEGDVGRVPAIAGQRQLFERGFLRQIFGQVEIFHDLGDELLRRLPQRHLLGLVEALALALADPFALARHRLHPLVQALAGEERHDQRIGGRAHRDRGEQHGHEVRVVELGGDEIEHDAPSEVEVDHFFHHHDADRHPAGAADQHQLARSDGSTAARCSRAW